MVAADIKGRYVVYGGADDDPSDLLSAPIFRAARVGVMAWVRRRLGCFACLLLLLLKYGLGWTNCD